MSEYQYYEFVAIDRPLNSAQQGELRALSSRAQITASSFVNIYNYGDFRGDPRALMERYFDAFLYLANWGTRRVALRVPVGFLDPDTVAAYCVDEPASWWTTQDHVILELSSEDEESDWECDGEGWLASIVPARAELLAGDTRLLYLAWLLCVQARELDEEEVEPPVPPGLRQLSGPLRSLADFLRLDEDLLAVATETSPTLSAAAPSSAALTQWAQGLPDTDKDAIIGRLLQGDDAHLRTELLRRFRGASAGAGATEGSAAGGARTVGELLAAAEAHWEKRQQLARQREAAERARQERAAALAREQRLQALSGRDEEAWRQVADMIETKKPKEYDAAVELLIDLKAISERDDRSAEFGQRVRLLRQQHARKPSLLDRLDRVGL